MAEQMRETIRKIDLDAFGIENTRTRPSIAGGFKIEIAGDDKGAKAELASKLRETIGGEGVKVSRPSMMWGLS